MSMNEQRALSIWFENMERKALNSGKPPKPTRWSDLRSRIANQSERARLEAAVISSFQTYSLASEVKRKRYRFQ